MGATNGLVLAAHRPDLVRALALADRKVATAGLGTEERYHHWFATWPVPFPTMAAVREFFGSEWPSYADYFMEVMAEDPDGYRPLFRFVDMLSSCVDWDRRDYWTELEQVQCPTLVVKGGVSDAPREQLQEMARRLPNGRYVEVEGAEHVVHYDRPEAWRRAVESFLLELKLIA